MNKNVRSGTGKTSPIDSIEVGPRQPAVTPDGEQAAEPPPYPFRWSYLRDDGIALRGLADALVGFSKTPVADRNVENVENVLALLDKVSTNIKRAQRYLARALWDVQHRQRLLPLIGVEGGVRARSGTPAEDKLHDRLGTLLDVKQKRAVVDFGEVDGDSRTWDIPLTCLVPAEQEQQGN
jgi:hypothetical protein